MVSQGGIGRRPADGRRISGGNQAARTTARVSSRSAGFSIGFEQNRSVQMNAWGASETGKRTSPIAKESTAGSRTSSRL